jgi:hypothetical protein
MGGGAGWGGGVFVSEQLLSEQALTIIIRQSVAEYLITLL